MLQSVENIMGSTFADTITGNNGNNALWGNGGNDVIYGLGGDDYSQDSYSPQNSGDDCYYGGAGNDYFVGMGGTDRLYGGEGEDTYVFNPGDGIDFIEDSEGWSMVLFGRPTGITLADLNVSYVTINSDMTSYVSNIDSPDLLIKYRENDAILIRGGRSENLNFQYNLQNNSIITSHSKILELAKTVQYLGDSADCVEGSSAVDVIYGGGGDDTIFGNGGDDELYGDTGNDTLIGGLGTDLLVGGEGDDTYGVDSLADTVVESAEEGVDTIESSVDFTLGAYVENLILTDSAYQGIGNDESNIITGTYWGELFGYDAHYIDIDGNVDVGNSLQDKVYFGGNKIDDNIEGSLLGGEDHLYDSSPKAFSPHRAVFEIAAEDGRVTI
jgi:Ca2+-binding RTX toxin-like protein